MTNMKQTRKVSYNSWLELEDITTHNTACFQFFYGS